MKALVVAVHPDPSSLTHAAAAAIARGIDESGGTSEIADLVKEGFDPRYRLDDRAVHHRRSAPPMDVVREQQRLESANALVLVYPVFWWSMPAYLKGWIERVFSNGWAFEDGPGGKGLIKKLDWLPVHLLGLAGADQAVYERRGYRDAMITQAELGVFNYCGAPVLSSEILYASETSSASIALEAAERFGGRVFEPRP